MMKKNLSKSGDRFKKQNKDNYRHKYTNKSHIKG